MKLLVKILPLLIGVFLGILNAFIWRKIGIYDNPELLKWDQTIDIFPIDIFNYFLIALIFTASLLCPLILNKDFKPIKSYMVSGITLLITFWIVGFWLDYQIKGLFWMGYMGDDNGFLIMFFASFLLFPVFLNLVLKRILCKTPLLFGLTLLLLAGLSIWLAYYETWPKGTSSPLLGRHDVFVKTIRKGHFLFWMTLMLMLSGCVLSIYQKRKLT